MIKILEINGSEWMMVLKKVLMIVGLDISVGVGM